MLSSGVKGLFVEDMSVASGPRVSERSFDITLFWYLLLAAFLNLTIPSSLFVTQDARILLIFSFRRH